MFMQRAGHERAWAAPAKALVHLADQTDATLVAEGIETEAHFRTARALGITVGQGYLIARPCTPADIAPSFSHIQAAEQHRQLAVT